MKVKELIKELNKYDEDLDCYTFDGEYGEIFVKRVYNMDRKPGVMIT